MRQELEQAFNRALFFSLTRKKIFFILPILLFCGIIVVLSHTLWIGSNPWIRSSLAFIPGFICMALFLAAAVPLIRLYHDEVKQKPLSVNKTLKHSWKLMAGIGSLIVPILTAYLVLWFILGIFYLLKNIPATGEILGAAVIRPLSSHCRIAPSSCDLTHADLFSIACGRSQIDHELGACRRCAETFRQGAVSPCHASSDRRFSSHFGSGISGFVGNAHRDDLLCHGENMGDRPAVVCHHDSICHAAFASCDLPVQLRS